MRARIRGLRAAALVGLLALTAACRATIPTAAENDWARVTAAGVMIRRVEESPGAYTLNYWFAFDGKRADIERVDVLDVTDGNSVVLVRGGQVGAESGWASERLPISRQTVPWLFERGPTRKRFQFVLYSRTGEVSVLVQEAVFADNLKQFYRTAAAL